MKEQPYYTFHLELQRQSPEDKRLFLPPETQLHHYPRYDDAFADLFTIEVQHLYRDTVILGKLDHLVINAFVTPPFEDKPIAVLKHIDYARDHANPRPNFLIEQLRPDLLSQETARFLVTHNVKDPAENTIFLARYDNVWTLQHYISAPALRNAILSQFKPHYFQAEIISSAHDTLASPGTDGKISHSVYNSLDPRECLFHMLKVDLNTLNPSTGNKAQHEAIETAVMTGPYELAIMLEVYRTRHRDDNLKGLPDRILLQINEPNEQAAREHMPELSGLENGPTTLTKTLARYNHIHNDLEYSPAPISLRSKLASLYAPTVRKNHPGRYIREETGRNAKKI